MMLSDRTARYWTARKLMAVAGDAPVLPAEIEDMGQRFAAWHGALKLLADPKRLADAVKAVGAAVDEFRVAEAAAAPVLARADELEQRAAEVEQREAALDSVDELARREAEVQERETALAAEAAQLAKRVAALQKREDAIAERETKIRAALA